MERKDGQGRLRQRNARVRLVGEKWQRLFGDLPDTAATGFQEGGTHDPRS